MSAALKDEGVSVSSAARIALTKAKGNVDAAASELLSRVRKDRKLREALLEPLVEQACRDAINREVRTERHFAWIQPGETVLNPQQRERVVALAAGTLLMFPLPGGKRLQDATREEIAAASQFYERQAGDMAHKARWLQLVAQSVPNGKTAGKVLNDARLRELQEEARNA